MNITALITEYNPFHNGHLYHLQQARTLTGADAVLVLMSGNFVQRGLPALVDKYRRAEMALRAGADAVLELPVAAATASAEGFAMGAVSLLHQLGAVTHLVYGCETADTKAIQDLAEFLLEEPPAFRQALRQALKQGLSFPAARWEAVRRLRPEAAPLLRDPNNILAVEYHKALTRLRSPIRPHALERRGAGYHESASSIRRLLAAGDMTGLAGLVPDFVPDLLPYTLNADDFSQQLLYRLYTLEPERLTRFGDVTPELAARIRRALSPDLTFRQLAARVKSPAHTLTRVHRALLHILLGIEKGEPALPSAVRLLGLCRGTRALQAVRQRSALPVAAKYADFPPEVFAPERRAANLYRLALWHRRGILLPDEYHSGPVIIETGRWTEGTAPT